MGRTIRFECPRAGKRRLKTCHIACRVTAGSHVIDSEPNVPALPTPQGAAPGMLPRRMNLLNAGNSRRRKLLAGRDPETSEYAVRKQAENLRQGRSAQRERNEEFFE